MHCSHSVCKWWGTSKEGKWKVLWGETGTNILTWNTCWWTVRVHKGVSLLSRWLDDQHLLHSDLFKVWIESEHLTKHIISQQAAEKRSDMLSRDQVQARSCPILTATVSPHSLDEQKQPTKTSGCVRREYASPSTAHQEQWSCLSPAGKQS